MRKRREFFGDTRQTSPSIPAAPCGACPGPRPVPDPSRAWMGVCPRCTGSGGLGPVPQHFPLLSSLGSAPTSRGPGLGAAIAPAAASRAPAASPPPRCRSRSPPLLLDRPIARRRSRLHPIRAGGAGDRLRVPPPGLQHPSDPGPGRGGAAACCSGSPGGKTPPAQVRLLKGARVSGPFGEAGNLNPNPAHPLGREIPTDCPSGEETKVQREK